MSVFWLARAAALPGERYRTLSAHHHEIRKEPCATRGRIMIACLFVEDGEEQAIKIRPMILVDDSEATVAYALERIGMIQAIVAGVSRGISTQAACSRCYRAEDHPAASLTHAPNCQHLAPQVFAFIDWIAEVSEMTAKKDFILGL